MKEQRPAVALISKAPDEPDERAAWGKQMARVQIAMWVDGKFACAQCGKVYASVDDFLARNPRYASAKGEPFAAVDDSCFAAWESR